MAQHAAQIRRRTPALRLAGESKLLGTEPDFLVLTEQAQEPPRLGKAPAAAAMAVILVPVVLGWLPIYLAAILGRR